MLPCACFFRAAVREKNVAALTIFRAPSPNAHTNVAALIERHAGQQVTGGLDDRVMPPNLSLRGGRRPTWRPEREARGSALGVQSREGSHDFADSLPGIRLSSARLPRRFAPRNDTSGEREVHQRPPTVELLPTGRSLSAATDPVGGGCHFNDSLCESFVQHREGHAPPLQWRVPRNGGRYGTAVPSRDCHGREAPSQ